ncbi:hypothetical protein AMJ82_11015 [candidate division TA06 bacterium SM23_40]|uniref:Uncharacterized protein n=1 Tax=candidate division TA06 bacterium SM23_40 TaxID=1703774 RepID=A0A0S8G5W0_UNCT6|nr:MAG: hypothetical protein AMJ82_11015 [candidate division TA06 bacterium SM23_40]
MDTRKLVEGIRNTVIAVAAIAAAMGYSKGDSAEGAVDRMLEQLSERVAKQEAVINAQSEKLEKLARRMIFFQGHQAGISAGALQAKAEQLERQLAETRARRPRPKVLNTLRGEKRPAKPAKRPPPEPAPPPPEQQKIPRLEPMQFRRGK